MNVCIVANAYAHSKNTAASLNRSSSGPLAESSSGFIRNNTNNSNNTQQLNINKNNKFVPHSIIQLRWGARFKSAHNKRKRKTDLTLLELHSRFEHKVLEVSVGFCFPQQKKGSGRSNRLVTPCDAYIKTCITANLR